MVRRFLSPRNLVIEPGILPVCNALNARDGFRTLWSCEGHYGSPSMPFVIFQASQDTAFELDKLLTTAFEDGRLCFWWNLTANFRDDGSLQYRISPNDSRMRQNWRYLPLVRKQIDRELVKLARLLS